MRLGFWRRCRKVFRWLRITIWFVLLAAVCALLWFNQVGLPDFLKKRFVTECRARGVDLEFSRLRLHFVRGIVADNIRIGDAKAADSPALSVREIQVRLDFHALLHRRLQVDGLVLRQGKLVWPFSPTNALTIDNIQTEVRFSTNDDWSLDNFHADFAGAKLAVSGEVVHARELRNWDVFKGGKSRGHGAGQPQLKQFADMMARVRFAGTPQLSLTINGDARDISSLVVRLNATAPGVETPAFNAREFQLSANLLSSTNQLPSAATNRLDSTWGFWTNAQAYQLVWSVHCLDVWSEKVSLDSLALGGYWRAPEIVLTNLAIGVAGGRLGVAARLNVNTRELHFTNASSFDLSAALTLLPDKMREKLADLSWGQPPQVRLGGSLILPDWTNQPPDWAGFVRRNVRLDGELEFADLTLRGAPFRTAKTHFSYANRVWRLPDAQLIQGKTWLVFDGGGDETNYQGRIWGTFDPETIRPLLTSSNGVHVLELFKFSQALTLDLKFAGRTRDYDSIVARGSLALTNFALRDQAMDSVAGTFYYTNRLLEFPSPCLMRGGGTQQLTAEKVVVDLRTRLVHITKGFSTADPLAIARAIGPKTGKFLETYQFLQPPTAWVNGTVTMNNIHRPEDAAGTDLTFDIVRGGPFRWLRLNTPRIEGTLRWTGAGLILTNVTAWAYGGKENGFATFDFNAPHPGADYFFTADVHDADLHALAADVSSPTNKLEGTFSGELVITDASTENLQTWNGYGDVKLHDGLIWDIPIFGILSPVLNTFVPGLGNSRATDALAQYNITNGVVFTDSLDIRCGLGQLQYVGTVDLQQNVNARVTARLLHNTWVVGPMISAVLWPVSKALEYRVTGTLKDPHSEPLYVPSFLLMPLHPIRSIEGLFPGDTNAPSKK